MEKRTSKRHLIGFKAELLYGGKSYAGVVENISEKGLYVISCSLNKTIDFTSGSELNIKYQLFSGRVVDLRCEVKWSYKTSSHGLTYSMGMEILKQSPEYIAYYSALK